MNDDFLKLLGLYPLEAQGKRSDGETGICPVRPWQALRVFPPEALLSKTSTSDPRDSSSSREMAKQMTETTIQLTIKHDKPLPDLLISTIEQRAYDYCVARSIRIEVEGKVWYETTKEQA